MQRERETGEGDKGEVKGTGEGDEGEAEGKGNRGG